MKVLSQSAQKYITAVTIALSRPQKVYGLEYLAGFIWLVRFRSIQTIAGYFGGGDMDRPAEMVDASQDFVAAKVYSIDGFWYSCEEIINAVSLAGWIYAAAIKTNRNVIINGHKVPVRNLAKGPRDYQPMRLSKRRTFRVAKTVVSLPKVGMLVEYFSSFFYQVITNFSIPPIDENKQVIQEWKWSWVN